MLLRAHPLVDQARGKYDATHLAQAQNVATRLPPYIHARGRRALDLQAPIYARTEEHPASPQVHTRPPLSRQGL